jgi:CHAD domain-containing protein
MSHGTPAGGLESRVDTEKRPRRARAAAKGVKLFSGGYVPLSEAGREALGFYLTRLRKAVSALGRSYDADTVHDARVAVRGLRAMIKLLDGAPAFDRKQLRHYSRRLRGLAQALGDVRDMDVLLEHLQAYLTQHEEAEAGLDSLAKELRQRRRAGAKEVQDTLARQHIRQLVKEMQDEFRTRRPGKVETADRPAASLLVRHFAGSAIWQRYQEILQYETGLADASGETLHTLRIACKRLRYSMQIFGHTPAPLEEVMATLKAAQDHLGNLHDVLSAQQLIRGLMSASSNGDAGSYVDYADYLPYADYLDALGREAALLKVGIGPIWESLSGTQMRQTIASFIASL